MSRDRNYETRNTPLTEQERQEVEDPNNNDKVVVNGQHIGCHFYMWSQDGTREEILGWKVRGHVIKPRGEDCFFYPFSDGVSLDAAEELERRVADRRESEKDRALTRRAFKVAAAALAVSILATIANTVIQLVAAK